MAPKKTLAHARAQTQAQAQAHVSRDDDEITIDDTVPAVPVVSGDPAVLGDPEYDGLGYDDDDVDDVDDVDDDGDDDEFDAAGFFGNLTDGGFGAIAEQADVVDVLTSVFISRDGEPVVDVLSRIAEGIEMQNKLVYKLVRCLETKLP